MDKWITIKTFAHPMDAAVIRGRLESEGIACFLKNEIIIQVNPFYSDAVGGVELQIRESDMENALMILKDGGYLTGEEDSSSAFLLKFDVVTSKIPFLKRLHLPFRLIVLITVCVGISILVFVYATLPTTYERLTSNIWCLDYVVYRNKKFIPQTNESFKLTGIQICAEDLSFRQNGTVILPGFRSNAVWGQWKLENDLLQISQTDTLDFVYNGIYEVSFSDNRLILKSAATTLECHIEKLKMNIPF